ncbi:MAG: hypothetical protein NVSMB58_35390 [Terriglobales bacterium]
MDEIAALGFRMKDLPFASECESKPAYRRIGTQRKQKKERGEKLLPKKKPVKRILGSTIVRGSRKKISEIARRLGSIPCAPGLKRGMPVKLRECPRCGELISGMQAKRMDKANPHVCPKKRV